jgi:ABC-type branched-subunit amino acid transport system substrate-binding protein
MFRFRSLPALAGIMLVAGAALGGSADAKPAHSAHGMVVVPHGQPLQITVAVADTGFAASFGPSVRDAVQMAIERQPAIRGFAIQVNAVDAPCGAGSDASLALNAAVATAIVANAQNTAVIGSLCSAEAPAWLPIYEAAGMVAINGSTTGPSVPAFGPTVFDATTVPDPGFTDSWYPAVQALPSDVQWRSRFQARFGFPPADFADLYYDATNVLLAALRKTAKGHHGSLVIDRAKLAAIVRHTRRFPGVSCTITMDPATGYRIDDPAALARCARER